MTRNLVFLLAISVITARAADPVRSVEIKHTRNQTIREVSMLVVTGAFDAWATNQAHKMWVSQPNGYFTEYNPALKPFVGKPTVYIAIPVGDLAIYGGLRLLKKPRAAKAYAYGMSVAHIGLGWNNLRQKPEGVR